MPTLYDELAATQPASAPNTNLYDELAAKTTTQPATQPFTQPAPTVQPANDVPDFLGQIGRRALPYFTSPEPQEPAQIDPANPQQLKLPPEMTAQLMNGRGNWYTPAPAYGDTGPADAGMGMLLMKRKLDAIAKQLTTTTDAAQRAALQKDFSETAAAWAAYQQQQIQAGDGAGRDIGHAVFNQASRSDNPLGAAPLNINAPAPQSALGNAGSAAISSWADPLANLVIRTQSALGLENPRQAQSEMNVHPLPYDPTRTSGMIGAGGGQAALMMGTGGTAGGLILGANAAEQSVEGMEARARQGQTASRGGQITDVVGQVLLNYALGKLAPGQKLNQAVLQGMLPELKHVALQTTQRIIASAGIRAGEGAAVQLAANALDKFTGTDAQRQMTEGVPSATVQGAVMGGATEAAHAIITGLGTAVQAWKDRPLTAQARGLMDQYGIDPENRGSLLRLLRAQKLTESGEAANVGEAMSQAGVTGADLTFGQRLQQFIRGGKPPVQQGGETGATAEPTTPQKMLGQGVELKPNQRPIFMQGATIRETTDGRYVATWNDGTPATTPQPDAVAAMQAWHNRPDQQAAAPTPVSLGQSDSTAPARSAGTDVRYNDTSAAPAAGATQPPQPAAPPIPAQPQNRPLGDKPILTSPNAGQDVAGFTTAWQPREGYNMQAIRTMGNDITGMPDDYNVVNKLAPGQMAVVQGKTQRWEIISGLDQLGRRIITNYRVAPAGEQPTGSAQQNGPPDFTSATTAEGRNAPERQGEPAPIVPPAPASGKGRTPTRPESTPFTKAAIERQLIDYHESVGGGYTLEDEKALQNFANPFTFQGKLPGDVKNFLESVPAARRLFRVTDQPSQADGEDAMHQLGDQYWRIIENIAGSKVKTAKQSAARSDNPWVQWLAAAHDNLPPAGERPRQIGVDPHALATGQEWEMWGSKWHLVEDADGLKAMRDGEDYPEVPINAIPEGQKIPIDKGTLKEASEPALPEGDFTEGLADHPGQLGLYGQDVPDRSKLTGSQQPMFPQDWGKAPVAGAKGMQTPALAEDQGMQRQYPEEGTPALPGLQGALASRPKPTGQISGFNFAPDMQKRIADAQQIARSMTVPELLKWRERIVAQGKTDIFRDIGVRLVDEELAARGEQADLFPTAQKPANNVQSGDVVRDGSQSLEPQPGSGQAAAGGGAAGTLGRGAERAGADALGEPGAGAATPAGRTAGRGAAAGDAATLPRGTAGAGQAGGGTGAIEPGGGGQVAAGQAGRTVPNQRGVNEPSIYSKPELDEMPFADLRKLVERWGMDAKPTGEGGMRQRMINGIVEAQGARTPEKAPWEDGTAAAAPGPNDPLPKVPLMTRLKMFRAKPETMSRQDLSNFVRDKLGVAIAQGVNRRRALGFYRFAGAGRIIRLKRINEIGVLAHELGHHLDYLVTGLKTARTWDNELLKLGAPTSRASYTKKQIRMEGIAEFTRYYLMNPDEARRRAPAYFQQFESQLVQHSLLWEPLKQLQSMYQAYLAQDGPTRLRAQVAYDDPSPTARSANDHGLSGLYVSMVDDLAPLDWLRRDLEGPDPMAPTNVNGGRFGQRNAGRMPMMLSQDAYSLARLNKGNKAKVLDWVKHGILDDNGNMIQRGLEPILKDAGATMPAKQRDLQDYMIAQRAIELYDQVRAGKRELRNVHDEFGGPLGITEQDARDTLKKFDSPEFQKAADEIRTWEREAGPRYAVKAGYYSQKDADALEKMNQYHVPLHRVMDLVEQKGTGTAGALVDRPKLFHKIMGSGRRILPPFQTMIRNTLRLVENVEANRAAVAAFKMLKASDRGGVYADPVAKPLEMQAGTLQEIKSTLIAAGVPKDLLESHGNDPPAVDLETAFRLFRPTQHNPAKMEAAIREDGKINVWQVHDPVLYRAVTGDLSPHTANAFVRVLVLGKQFLRAGVTGALGFAPTTAERHQFMAPLLSRYGYNFYKGDFFKGMLHILTSSERYHQWLQARGADSNEVSWYTNKFERKIGRLGQSLPRRLGGAVINPAAWLHGMESVSELFGNSTRMGEFIKAINEEGVNEEGLMRAGLASRDVGIDYARGGDWARKVGQYAAFFNANIQAKDALARAFKNDPVGSTIKALLGVTMMSLALHFLSRENPHYQERKRERDHYWLIPLGNPATTDRFFRVMKPWELGQVFGSWAEDVVDALHEHDPAALKEILPDKDTAMDVLMDTLPTVIRPAMENEAGVGGYDYHFKRPIVPEHEQKLEPSMQYGHYTSETAKQLGKLMNVSPRKIDHVIYGYTGSLGAEATAALDKIVMRPLAGAEGQTLPSQDFPADAPGLSRFFGRDLDASSADSVLRIYDRLHEVDQAKATLMAMEKRGSAAADAYAKDHADVLADVDRAQAVRQQLAGLRGSIDAVFEDKKMTPQEKQQQLREINIQMINVARGYLGKTQIQ